MFNARDKALDREFMVSEPRGPEGSWHLKYSHAERVAMIHDQQPHVIAQRWWDRFPLIWPLIAQMEVRARWCEHIALWSSWPYMRAWRKIHR